MDDSDLPLVVQAFLRDQIASLEQLECLLLLFRRSEIPWTASEVASELHLEPSAVQEALRALCERGLLTIVATPGQFRYGPSSPQLAAAVERLAELDGDQRVAVMRLLTANAIQRLRTGALGILSNALATGKREKPSG